ncbi:hypothetical protein BD779DRAFT_625132 [Infundibulicybe gibba]|nr:hypothetical protein BD779DRAFT_625132 [Infundibulicybe gibba]
MCVDVISDSFIVTIPLATFWNIKLLRNQRRLLFAGFSSGIWTTAVTIAGVVIMLRYRAPLLGVIMPHLEVRSTFCSVTPITAPAGHRVAVVMQLPGCCCHDLQGLPAGRRSRGLILQL